MEAGESRRRWNALARLSLSPQQPCIARTAAKTLRLALSLNLRSHGLQRTQHGLGDSGNHPEGGGLGSWRFTEIYKGFGLNYHSHRC